MDEILARLRQQYHDQLAERLERLKALFASPLSSEEVDETRLLAHALAGSGGTYGYPRVSQLAAQLEEGEVASLAAHAQALMAELERVLRVPPESGEEPASAGP